MIDRLTMLVVSSRKRGNILMSGKESAIFQESAAIDRPADLYETDFYTWTRRQADLLRSGRAAEADLSNIAEEIETLGRSEASALRSAYRLILLHLLKLRFQPEKQSNSWRATIVRERGQVEETLADNPGLRPRRTELFERAYGAARRETAAETKLALKMFPEEPPFSLDQVEDQTFWPQAAGR